MNQFLGTIIVTMEEESPYENVQRRLQEVQQEELRLAEALVRLLQETAASRGAEGTWLELVQRWERGETVIGALKLCLEMMQERDPQEVENLSRQLRHWRRKEGREQIGWLEVRTVKGYGPYVSYRYRRSGERKIETEYYGRVDRALEHLKTLPIETERETSAASPPDRKKRTKRKGGAAGAEE